LKLLVLSIHALRSAEPVRSHLARKSFFGQRDNNCPLNQPSGRCQVLELRADKPPSPISVQPWANIIQGRCWIRQDNAFRRRVRNIAFTAQGDVLESDELFALMSRANPAIRSEMIGLRLCGIELDPSDLAKCPVLAHRAMPMTNTSAQTISEREAISASVLRYSA